MTNGMFVDCVDRFWESLSKAQRDLLYAAIGALELRSQQPKTHAHPALGYVSPVESRPKYLTLEQVGKILQHQSDLGWTVEEAAAYADVVKGDWIQKGDGSWIRGYRGGSHVMEVTPTGLNFWTMQAWENAHGRL